MGELGPDSNVESKRLQFWLGHGKSELEQDAITEKILTTFITAEQSGALQITTDPEESPHHFGAFYDWLSKHRAVYEDMLSGYEKRGVTQPIQNRILTVLEDEVESTERRQAALGFFLGRCANVVLPEVDRLAKNHPEITGVGTVQDEMLSKLGRNWSADDDEKRAIRNIIADVQRSIKYPKHGEFAGVGIDWDRLVLPAIINYFTILSSPDRVEAIIGTDILRIKNELKREFEHYAAHLLGIRLERVITGSYREIIQLLSAGKSLYQIAKELSITYEEVAELLDIFDRLQSQDQPLQDLSRDEIILQLQTSGIAGPSLTDLEPVDPHYPNMTTTKAQLARERKLSAVQIRPDDFANLFIAKLVANGYRFVDRADREVLLGGDRVFVDQAEPALDPENHLRQARLVAEVEAVVDGLDNERQKQVLAYRFGLYGLKPHTLDEVAEIFGVSPERMR